MLLCVQEVRLNRALEEVERCKAALTAERTHKRGDMQQEKKDVDRLEGTDRHVITTQHSKPECGPYLTEISSRGLWSSE